MYRVKTTSRTIIEIPKPHVPDGKVLAPGDPEYEEKIFIGNLMYNQKKPAFVVIAKSTRDVRATILFARMHKVKMTVMNGGHSYAGYCLNKGGIVLNITEMNTIDFDPKKKTVTVEAGAIWKDVYAKLVGNSVRYIIIGGQCPTVGVSGFTLGGGLSPFSRGYGLGCDNLLSMTLVTAAGETVTVGPNEHDPARQNLWWAVRGGGGGNFGVTTSLTLRVHELHNDTVVAGELTWNLPDQLDEFNQAMAILNAGVPNELCVDAIWTFSSGKLLAMMTCIYNGTMEQATDVLSGILSHKPDNGLKSMHWVDWEKIEEGFDTKTSIFHHHVSLIFAEGAITQEVSNIIHDLMLTSPALAKDKDGNLVQKNHILWDHAGGVMKKIPSNATAYYWRDGVYVLTAKVQWSDRSQTAIAMKWANTVKEKLTPFALNQQASYLNYIDATLANWQTAYYGTNYSQLQHVKSQWDPTNFFHFRQSIKPATTTSIQGPFIWQNWAENIIAYPSRIDTPKTLEELIVIVNHARENGRKIRVAGSGHSWGPLVPTNDILVKLDNFTNISISLEKTHVKVGAGVTVDQLAAFLTSNGVCFPSNVGHGVGEATYGGVISTGCHGSGISFLSISDYAVGFKVITSSGEIRKFDESNLEQLNAIRLSLGLYGIIVSIRFKVEPIYSVHVREWKTSIGDGFSHLKDLVLNNDYAELNWMPFNNTVYLQVANKTQEKITRVGQNPPKSPFQKQLDQLVAAAAIQTIVTSPEQTPDVMRANFQALPVYDYVSNINDYIHNADWHSIISAKVLDIEIAISIDDDFKSVKKAFKICQDAVNKWSAANLYPFNGTLGFRFISHSDAVLSPANGNTRTALVEISSFYRSPLFQQLSGELIQQLINELPNARPHWAKGFGFMPESIPYLRRSFGNQLVDFWKLRTEANVDPHGMFVNDFLNELFANAQLQVNGGNITNY